MGYMLHGVISGKDEVHYYHMHTACDVLTLQSNDSHNCNYFSHNTVSPQIFIKCYSTQTSLLTNNRTNDDESSAIHLVSLETHQKCKISSSSSSDKPDSVGRHIWCCGLHRKPAMLHEQSRSRRRQTVGLVRARSETDRLSPQSEQRLKQIATTTKNTLPSLLELNSY